MILLHVCAFVTATACLITRNYFGTNRGERKFISDAYRHTYTVSIIQQIAPYHPLSPPYSMRAPR